MPALMLGDVKDVLKGMQDNSIDSVVTDPPYELGFMGKSWDSTGIAYDVEIWKEVHRVLKPGGHLLSFGGSRTYHRMACAVEDAGFEIRDQIIWCQGQGFPKSKNVGNGLGTALKPSIEPIVLARKPFVGTVEQNIAEYGTGALNIDACRVPGEPVPINKLTKWSGFGQEKRPDYEATVNDQGRWPGNLIHDGSDEVVSLFPTSKSGAMKAATKRAAQDEPGSVCYGTIGGSISSKDYVASSGSASRFFMKCEETDDEWLDRNLHREVVSTVEGYLYLPRVLASSVLKDAAISVLPEGAYCEILFQEPSTNVTPSELRMLATSVIETILNLEQRSWLERQQGKRFQSNNPVSHVVTLEPTGITTITQSLSRSGGSAVRVTYSITLKSPEPGERALEPNSLIYCAKANKKDRGEGNDHPTVKPTELMRYLIRLVTPKGGTVLDPFVGSGTTAVAALKEGCGVIGIDNNAHHIEIASSRITDYLRHAEA